jgi:Subtilase family
MRASLTPGKDRPVRDGRGRSGGLGAEALEVRRLLSAAISTSQDPTGVSSLLLQLAQSGQPSSAVVAVNGSFSIPNKMIFNSSGDVAVEITAQNVSALSGPLAALGFEPAGSDSADHLIDGYLPISSINSIGALSSDGLMGVLPEYKPLLSSGVVDSQGDSILEADRARAATGDSGAGVTVGVLSDSYNNLGTASQGVASGDLPGNVNVLQDDPSGGTDEGRAMLEIVHDLAPGANLAFATADISEAQFAANIVNLATPKSQGGAGANIIADDITYFDEPYYQDGIIAQAVNNVVTHDNVSYFVAAGNLDNQAYESANVGFVSDTISGISASPGSYYNFNQGGAAVDEQTLTLQAGQEIDLGLQWDNPFYTTNGVTSDLNFFAINASNGQVIASSTLNTIGNQTPFQFLSVVNSGSASANIELVIQLASGPAPGRLKYENFGSNDFGDVQFDDFETDSPTINPHAAAVDAMAVAATPFYDERDPETFTSEGPSTLIFDDTGNRLSSPEVVAKPNIAATDGASTSFFGQTIGGLSFPVFFGTSAATPHAAAVAALVLQSHPTWSPFQIYSDLESTADPNIGSTPGNPELVGAGLIDAYRAVVGTPIAASLPVSDTFASGVIGQDWETYTANAGRTDVSSTGGPDELVLDSNLQPNVPNEFFETSELSEAILHLNLAGDTGVSLQFNETAFGNEFETDQPMPPSFVGHGNFDGVAISVDGVHWFRITTLAGANASTTSTAFTFNLSNIAALYGLTLGANTQVKFQHCDPDSLSAPNGGFAFSSVAVVGAPTSLALNGPAFYLKLDADQVHLDVWDANTATGSPNQSVLLSSISGISVTGSGAVDSLTVDFTAGDPLVASGLSDNPTGTGVNSLTIVGDGGSDSVTVGNSTVNFSSTFGPVPMSFGNVGLVSFIGGAGSNTLTQSANPGDSGSVVFGNMTAADTLNVNGGVFTFPATATLGTLSIGSGASASIAAPATHASRAVLVLSSLAIAGASNNWLGQLNLTGNDLIVHNGNLATISNQLRSGFNAASGYWNGKGIVSSTAAADSTKLTTLGALLNSNSNGKWITTFDGQAASLTDVLIKYTYYGDANLDGVVNGDDYTLTDNGFNTFLSNWVNGDFTYQGSVGAADYMLIDNSDLFQGVPLVVTGNDVPAPAASSPVSAPSVISIPASSPGVAIPTPVRLNASLAQQIFDDPSNAN